MRECPIEDGKGAELILAYAARTLDPQMELAFEEHMRICEDCRRMAAAQREVWSALDSWTPAPVSQDFDEKLFRRIAEEEQSTWWRRLWGASWSWRPAMPVAAACAVLAAIVLLRNPAPSPAPVVPVQPKVQIEQVEHALDDMDLLRNIGVELPADQNKSTEKM